MDVSTLIQNLKQELTCPVCIHLYKEPKQLPCLHIFCLECLNGLVNSNAHQGQIKCPLCQIEVAVPDCGTMETLPDCFYLKNLLDLLIIKECNTSEVTCGNCDEKRDEVFYCFHCSKFWCKDCLNGHDILKENKEHRVIALRDFKEEDFEDVVRRPAFCQEDLHERKVLNLYCKMCQVPVCQNCVTLQHSTHDVEHLELTVQAVKNNIDCKLDSVKKSCRRFSDYIRELDEKFSLTDRRRQLVKGKIQETFKSLIVTLQEQERDLVTQLEEQSNETQEDLMKHKREFQEKLSKSEKAIVHIERLVERSTEAELVTTKTVIDELFQQLGQPQEIQPPVIEKKSLTVFLKNHEVIKGLQKSGIGHLYTTTTETDVKQCLVRGGDEVTAGLETKFEVITRNSAGEQFYSSADDIAVEIMGTQSRKPVAELNVVNKNDGRYEISFIPSKAGKHVLSVGINGETIRDLPPIHIKERTFKPMVHFGEQSIDEKKLNSPWGVTVNNSNDIFVTDMDNNRVLVFNDEGNFVRSFGENLLEEPTGISINNNGGIFVANRTSNKILLLDPDGDYVSTVISEGSLKDPRGISLDSQGHLIVCDSGNKCVKIVSVQGEVLSTFGEGCFRMPFDCVCYEDKIFVSDREGHMIKVYSKDGKLSHEFGGRGTRDGELYHPTGLAVDKTGHLLVCSEHSHKVQMFTFEGTFVSKFGTSGKDLGQLGRPTSISLLKSGHIVVCEFGNDRLQIFS